MQRRQLGWESSLRVCDPTSGPSDNQAADRVVRLTEQLRTELMEEESCASLYGGRAESADAGKRSQIEQ